MGHETGLIPILMLLEIYDNVLPPVASFLIFELHNSSSQGEAK